MSHFAHITNGVVDNVIVIEADTLALGHWGDPSEWVQTSYNTHGGVHANGGTPLHKNYAGIGYTYDSVDDVFYAPRPSNQTGVFYSWTISAPTWLWQPPIPCPKAGGPYYWDEQTQSWVLM